jgi:AcrR family transcriptional regulator
MQERSLITRSRILEAAMDSFSRNGYEATGVAELCALAQVSKGAFYHHFSSKQAVFLALFDNWLSQIDQLLDESRQPGRTAPQSILAMTGLMSLVFEQAAGRLPLFLEFWTQASHDPVVWQALMAPYQRYTDYFRQIVEDGIREGSLRPVDPLSAARTVVSLAIGLLLQGLLDPNPADWAPTTHQAYQALLDGLAIKEDQ